MWDAVLVALVIALAAAFLVRRFYRAMRHNEGCGCLLCPCENHGKPGGKPQCMQVNLRSLTPEEERRLAASYPPCYKHCLASGAPGKTGRGCGRQGVHLLQKEKRDE